MFERYRYVFPVLCAILTLVLIVLFIFKREDKKKLHHVLALWGLFFFWSVTYWENSTGKEMSIYSSLLRSDSICVEQSTGASKRLLTSDYYDPEEDSYRILDIDRLFLDQEIEYLVVGTVSFYEEERLIRSLKVVQFFEFPEGYGSWRIYLVDDNYYAFSDEGFFSAGYLYCFPDFFAEPVIRELINC